MNRPVQRFLAFSPPDGSGPEGVAANIMQTAGAEAYALAVRCLETGENLALPAPEGAGLHVWEGLIVLGEGGAPDDIDGSWRRATAEDLEAFGFPLSVDAGDLPASTCEATTVSPIPLPEVEPEAGPNYCCAMRRRFVPGIAAQDLSAPVPTEFADYVLRWGTPILFAIRHCPFCGVKIDHAQTLRVLDP